MAVKTVSLCEDIIKLAIADREAGVTDQTSPPCANKESAETKKKCVETTCKSEHKGNMAKALSAELL